MADDTSSPPQARRPSRDDLEALRSQRSLIAGHLAWLDARIAELEADKAKKAGTDAPPREDVVRPAPEAASAGEDSASGQESAAVAGAGPLVNELGSAERARAAGRQNARSIQMGCILMGVIAVVAFLVFFFVIPYFVF